MAILEVDCGTTKNEYIAVVDYIID